MEDDNLFEESENSQNISFYIEDPANIAQVIQVSEAIEIGEECTPNKNCDLKLLLEEWNLGETFESLTSCGFTYDRLKYIDKEDILLIFPGNENMGLRAELNGKIADWKSKNFVDNGANKIRGWTESQEPIVCENTSLVLSILQSSPVGNSILSSYSTNQSLVHSDRKKLISLITEHFYDPKKHKYSIPRPCVMEQLAEEIVDIFPRESKNIYYISRKEARKPNPNGLLFNRFNNLNRKRLKSETVTSVPNTSKINPDPDTISIQNKMKFMSGDESDAMEHWISTYDYRRPGIIQAQSLKSIFDEWPFFKQASASKYIDYDYERMYPNTRYHLLNKWKSVQAKLCSIYETHIKDKQYSELLHLLTPDVDDNSRDCITMMLLNAVLKPTARYVSKAQGKACFKKATISDAIQSSFVHIKCVNDLQMIREDNMQKAMERKLKIQPYVLVIGQKLSNLQEFYVCCDDTLYKFSSFVVALDVCFKTYNVFHLNYPTESVLIWSFLQKQVYEISTPFDTHSSALLEFINDFIK